MDLEQCSFSRPALGAGANLPGLASPEAAGHSSLTVHVGIQFSVIEIAFNLVAPIW
jgi:hypothetical protein